MILDDFHLLTDGPARESINWLVAHAPASFQLVLSTRKEPDLPLAALRAHGDLLELRADDLRFTSAEAGVFLNPRQRLGLTSADVDLLVERTDGWPAGLYLAALSLRRTDDRHDLVTRFGASNRHVIDFLEAEVLQAHDPADQELMVRCSILERLSGPLCDAVLELQQSKEALQRLSRSNLFLVPQDDDGGWYRFHPLFARLLRVALEQRDPGLAVTLHRRTYAWHREHGNTGEVIEHAIEAGMYTEATDLVAESWTEFANAGRHATVLTWLRRFPEATRSGDLRLLLAQAWVQAMSGQRVEAAGTIARAEELVEAGVDRLSDGSSLAEASLAALQAANPWAGVGTAREQALRAVELAGPGSPWRPVACWAAGLDHYTRGEFTQADQWFAESAALAPASAQWVVGCAFLGYRSLIAGKRGHLDMQTQLAEEATSFARDHGLEEVATTALLSLGVSLAARARPTDALPVMEHSVDVARFRGRPMLLERALRNYASVLRTMGEHEKSDAARAEAQSIRDAHPDLGYRADSVSTSEPLHREHITSGTGELTTREVTVLEFLTGDRSESDIARELFVSHSTVHRHARSIYHKPGASSRAEAVERAHAIGLL